MKGLGHGIVVVLVVVLANACVVSDGLPPCLTYTTTVATTTRRLVTWTLSRQKMRFVKLTTIHYETAFAALQTCVPEEIRDLVLANFYRALLLYSYCYFWELRIIRL